ncbi:MAG: prepilin-type N-terminal cleavage/methylation domain-containing protein [Kiritimatiellae bacterium]|nr:prepilin-type N-terminal cleavage/methylation domain-containing protein [Kiritimatiellia bacterium]
MKQTKEGFTLVELLVVIGILGVLMGALFPAISSAMLSANASAMSMRGRKLFEGITQVNIDREGKGRSSIWPHNDVNDGKSDDTDDIAGMSFGTSTEYFKEVFNMDKYGTEDWEPYVTSCDLSVLSGSGVPGVSSGSLTKNNVAWTVAKGLTSEMEEVVPVFITRNADKAAFPCASGVNKTDSVKTKITLGKTYAAPFGNKAFIVVHKGGSADVIKSKDAKIYLVYNQQSFTVPEGVTLSYIEP